MAIGTVFFMIICRIQVWMFGLTISRNEEENHYNPHGLNCLLKILNSESKRKRTKRKCVQDCELTKKSTFKVAGIRSDPVIFSLPDPVLFFTEPDPTCNNGHMIYISSLAKKAKPESTNSSFDQTF